MLPVCSATPSCSPHFEISFPGGLRPFGPFSKDCESRCIMEDRVVLGMSNGTYPRRISFKTQAEKSFYSNFIESNEPSVSLDFIDKPSWPSELDDMACKFYDDRSSSVANIYELHPLGRGELNCVETYSLSAAEEGLVDLTEKSTENADSLVVSVDPEAILASDITLESPSSVSASLDIDSDALSSVRTGVDDFLAGIRESISMTVNKGQNAVNSSLDSVTSSISSITESASKAIENSLNSVFSSIDATVESASNRLNSFSDDLAETSKKAAAGSVDVLRGVIVAVEDLVAKGASSVVYSYGSAKEVLPPEIRDTLNLSEERAGELLRPIGATFQQVYVAIEGLERSLGLDPNDPVVSFILILGTSATLWTSYWVWAYGGYSGDLSPQLTLELLAGKEDSVLIDIRPEVLRERDGIPDLRRGARFRYACVTLPEVDGSVRKLLRGGRELDDMLLACVIRNLKAVQDRYKVIVMDADGTRSKSIARSLRKLGFQRPYLVQGGFQSWVKEGLRIKDLKPETALSILNEEAEAILETVRPSPLQTLGYGVGFFAALYAALEWERTLQLIGIVGLGQTIYSRVASYKGPEDFKQDASRLLAPVRLGAEAFSWVAGKLETNGIGLPTSPSSSDVQNRVLKAAAKLESQPSDVEGAQNTSSQSAAPINENVDLSEAA